MSDKWNALLGEGKGQVRRTYGRKEKSNTNSNTNSSLFGSNNTSSTLGPRLSLQPNSNFHHDDVDLWSDMTNTTKNNNGIPSDFRLGVSSRRPPERHFQRLRLVRAPQRQRGTSDRHFIRPLRSEDEQFGSDEFVRGAAQRATIDRAGFTGRGIPPSDD